MAVNKLVDSTQLDADLTSVANAIRTKCGTSASLAFPSGFVSAVEAIPIGGGGYDVDAGDLTALFDKYVEENDMLVMDLTFASDQTANWTVNHSLGRAPVEALLYPKNFSRTFGGYMIGWVIDGSWAADRPGNRTMYPTTNAIPQSAIDQVWYPIAKNFPSLLYSIKATDYNFTQSAPTSTTATFRGGTNINTKLLAGEYRLALR